MNGKGLGKVQPEQEKANASGALTNRNSSWARGGNFRIVGNGSRLAPRNINRNKITGHIVSIDTPHPGRATRRRHLHCFSGKAWFSDRETSSTQERSGKWKTKTPGLAWLVPVPFDTRRCSAVEPGVRGPTSPAETALNCRTTRR